MFKKSLILGRQHRPDHDKRKIRITVYPPVLMSKLDHHLAFSIVYFAYGRLFEFDQRPHIKRFGSSKKEIVGRQDQVIQWPRVEIRREITKEYKHQKDPETYFECFEGQLQPFSQLSTPDFQSPIMEEILHHFSNLAS